MNNLQSNRVFRWSLLGLGILGLLVAGVAVLSTEGKFNTVSYIALAVGVLGVGGWVLVDPESITTALTGRTGVYGLTTIVMSLAFLAFVIALYVIIFAANIEPWDWTEAQRYQLSEDSIALLEGLDQDVRVIAFIGADSADEREEADLWLQQYQKYSNGHITYEFLDPDIARAEAQRLEASGAGAIVFESGGRHAEARFADERNLTGALTRVLSGEPRIAYLLTGHGERSADDFTEAGFSQASSYLESLNFQVNAFSLLQAESVPEDADLVIIAGPTAQYTASEVAALKAYTDAGGDLLVMLDPGSGGGALGRGVAGVAYSPDGTRIATAGSDGTARIWDAASGAELVILRGHTSQVWDVAFSPDGSMAATVGADSTVRVWDTASGQQVAQPTGEILQAWRVLFSPDGSLLAAVSRDGWVNVWVWNAETETFDPASYSPFQVENGLFAMAFSPDGTTLAAGGGSAIGENAPGLVYLWNTATGEETLSEELHTDLVMDIDFSADGLTLYSAARDGTLGTLDVATGTGTTETLYADLGLTSLTLAPDGSQIFGLRDGSVHIRAPGASVEDDTIVTAHTETVSAIEVSPDGLTFVSGSRDGTAQVVTIADQTVDFSLAGHAAVDELLAYLSTDWGITVNDDVVVDYGPEGFDPLSPVMFVGLDQELQSYSSYDEFSPITAPLNDSQVITVLALARSLTVAETQPEGVELTELLMTTPNASWSESDPLTVIQNIYTAQDPSIFFDPLDTIGPVTLAVSGEHEIGQNEDGSTNVARIVVFGDTDFASTAALSISTYGNSDLLLNTANWLTESEALIDLPGPDVGQRTMEPLPSWAQIVLAVTSICLIPLGLLVLGVVVWMIRRARR